MSTPHRFTCRVPIAPIRKEPKDSAEMVSQLLFGEEAFEIEEHHQWKKVKCIHDNYEGWLDKKQLGLLDIEKGQLLTQNSSYDLPNGTTMFLPIGARVNEDVSQEEVTLDILIERLLNTPYLWGGRSSFGIDCSGLTQLLKAFQGINIYRDAYQQAELGDLVPFLEEAKKGDLAFFNNENDKITHVGMILDKHTIVHAHGWVRIDFIDAQGIYNEEYGKHTHTLKLIKRITL